MTRTTKYFAMAMLATLTPALAGCGGLGYNAYKVRSQVTEGPAIAYGAKAAMTEFYQSHAQWPRSNAQADMPAATSFSGKYVTSVAVGTQPGSIVITYGGQATAQSLRGKVLVLAATVQKGIVSWHCDLDRTTIASQYLVGSCQQ